MALNPNMLTTLRPIAEAPAGFLFANPKSPIIRALVGSGHIVTNNAVDPSNADKIAYMATDTGRAEVGVVHPAPVAAIPAPVVTPAPSAPATPPTGEGTAPLETTTATTPAVPAVRKPRAVRPLPTIGHTGVRIAMPVSATSGRAPREEIYPFSKLGAPDATGHDSFFVHSTEHLPNPAKLLASTVGSANKRFKDEGRVFRIISVENDLEHKVAGARILRVK